MKTTFWIAGWVIVVLLVTGGAGDTVAQSSGILEINPVPGAPRAGMGASKINELISTEEIVIDDIQFRIARDATFFDKGHQRQVSLYFFKVGDLVRYNVNELGEIDDLWVFSEDGI
jgi:hypothetical protein